MTAGSAPDADCGSLHSLLLLVNSKQQFPEMGNWIRRGRRLFSCGLTLQGAEFLIEECRKCIRINNDFVIKGLLEGQELNALGDDAFQKRILLRAAHSFITASAAISGTVLTPAETGRVRTKGRL